MSGTWFNRLTFSYLPILVIVPAILMVVFFAGSAELSKRETARANAVFARQAVQSLDYSFRSINEMMNREILSGEFDLFFSAAANPYLAANDASTRLARLKLTNPLIDSLYVYRLSDGTILDNLSIRRLAAFPDREFVERTQAGPLPTRWSQPREIAGPGGQPRTVVTLTRGIPLLTGERGLMVVNVSLDSVRGLLREMIGEETSFIHLYAADGELMLGTETDLPAANAQPPGGESSAGAARAPNPGRELSAVASPYTGWEVRGGIVGDGLSTVLTGIWYAWLVAALLIMTLGIVWAALVSRRNYEPVVRLLQRLDALPPGTADAAAALTEAARLGERSDAERAADRQAERGHRRAPHPDEFERIESTLSAMIARAEADRKLRREDIGYRRREFFRELLEGTRVVEPGKWDEETRRLNVDGALPGSAGAEQETGGSGASRSSREGADADDVPRRDASAAHEAGGVPREQAGAAHESGFGPAVVGLLEIDRPEAFNDAYSERSRELLRYALAAAAAELAAARGAWLWAEWLPGGRLGLLLRLPAQTPRRGPGEAPGPDAVGAAAAIADELIAWIAAHLHCTVTVALGGAFGSPAGIALGFREAVEAIGYKSSLGGARVLVGRDLHRGAAADLYGVLRTIRELARAYRLGEPQWRDSLEELLGGLRAAPLPKDDLSGLMNVLAYQLLREMMELPGEAKELWHGEAAPRLGAALEHFDTLDELETSVRSLLSEYAVRLKLLRESRSSHVTLQEVRAFIDANFIDPDLSLSSIADRFGLSASYLSRLFKDAFGQNFVDYLAGIRVEAAQALLRDTEDPIRDIATRVGYANYMSFSRAFKKIVSATPGEYRTGSRAK